MSKLNVGHDLSDPDLDFNLNTFGTHTHALLISLPFLISSSPDMPENEATFAISGGGVTDAKE